MMLKPRPLPPLHRNQLHVPVRCIGLNEDGPAMPAFYRNHAVVRKMLKRRPPQAGPPNSSRISPDSDVTSNRQSTPNVQQRNYPMYVRGRAAGIDDVTLSFRDVKSPSVDARRSFRDVRRSFDDVSEPECAVHMTSPVEDGSRQNSSVQEHLPVSDDVPFSPRVLACSKYSIIGEPKNRKKRATRSVWTLPKLPLPKGFLTELDPEDGNTDVMPASGLSSVTKINTIDVRSIYGKKSKIHYVPSREDTVFASNKPPRQNTVILPPLQIHQQRGDMHLDAGCVAEKRIVMQQYTEPKVLRRIFRDHVAFPTSYKPYFRYKQRRETFAQSVFSANEFWENNRKPMHCSRCIHQSTATLHFCDVLGKRFCRFCSEMSDRSFSQAYEKSRLLVASPFKSPMLRMMREPSFIGVRKVIITKTTKDERQPQA